MMEEEPIHGEMPTIQKKEKRKYNLTSTGFRQKIEQNLDKNIKLIKKIKKEIYSQGSNTMFDMQRTIMKYDVDNSGRIDMDEYNRLCYEFNINLTPDELKTVFSCFDPSRTGKIYYDDFLNIIHDPLNDFRTELVDQLYESLNKNNRGNLEIKTVLGACGTQKLSQDKIDEFKDNLLLHHDFYGKGNTEIFYDEFINFFEILNVDFKEDGDFENFVNNFFLVDLSNNEKIEENENPKNIEESEGVLEILESLRKTLVNQGPNGVIELLKNFRNADLVKSNGIDLDEFLSIMENILKNDKNSFSFDEMKNLFNFYDLKETGIMEYQKFLNDLLKLKLMPKPIIMQIKI